jgi:hypothetical protein
MKIIEAEGGRIGLTRSQFLRMLVERHGGHVVFERPQGLQPYQVSESDMKTAQPYLWQVAPELRERVDADRLRMGNISVGAYLIGLINHWLGQPLGLDIKGEKKKR